MLCSDYVSNGWIETCAVALRLIAQKPINPLMSTQMDRRHQQGVVNLSGRVKHFLRYELHTPPLYTSSITMNSAPPLLNPDLSSGDEAFGHPTIETHPVLDRTLYYNTIPDANIRDIVTTILLLVSIFLTLGTIITVLCSSAKLNRAIRMLIHGRKLRPIYRHTPFDDEGFAESMV